MGLRHEDVGDDHAQGHAMLLLVTSIAIPNVNTTIPIIRIPIILLLFLQDGAWASGFYLSEFRMTLSRPS